MGRAVGGGRRLFYLILSWLEKPVLLLAWWVGERSEALGHWA